MCMCVYMCVCDCERESVSVNVCCVCVSLVTGRSSNKWSSVTIRLGKYITHIYMTCIYTLYSSCSVFKESIRVPCSKISWDS